MNTEATIIEPGQQAQEPDHSAGYHVDTSKGQMRGELSTQWMARPHDQRFLNLSDLRASVDARREASDEYRVDTHDLALIAPEPRSIEDTHQLMIASRDRSEPIAPTNWSFGQLASLAKAPPAYLRQLPSQIVADALRYGMRYNRESERIKLYSSGGELRAATGPDYGRIFDSDVVAAVQQVAGEGTGDSNWKIPGVLDWATGIYNPKAPVTIDSTTLYASDRDVFVFLVDDLNPIEVGKTRDGHPDLIFRGFYIANSEVGASSLVLAAFYLRGICCNRLMWGVEGFEELRMRHSKYAPSRFIEQARPALKSFAEGSTTKLIEGVEKAKAAKVADDRDEGLAFLRERGFSRTRSVDLFEKATNEEGHEPRSVWDFAQAITADARDIPHTDARIAQEGEARKLLDKVAA